MPNCAESKGGGCGVGNGVFVEFVRVAYWEEEGDQAAVGRQSGGRDRSDRDICWDCRR